MTIPLRLLIAMHSEDDALLAVRELQRAGYDPRWDRVESAKAFAEKLDAGPWDVVISDYAIPGFGGLEALATARQKDRDLPFIFLSRGIGEEAAVEAIKAGASDCILTDGLDRLPAAVGRELRDAELRRSTRAAEASARRAFEESARLYRLLTENANDVIWSCDLDMTFQYVSPAVEKLLGWTPDEVIEAGVKMTLPPESLRIASVNLQAVLYQYRSGRRVFEPVIFEIEQSRKDGTRVWTEVSASPFFDDDGRMAGISGVTRDISERKKTEKALLRAKQEWERTFDSVPDLITIIDNQYRILHANRAMAQRLGLTTEECVGKVCYESVHGVSAVPAFCPHALSLADGQEHSTEVHEERLGGDFLISCTPFFDEQGGRVGSVLVARDITMQKGIAEALHRSEEKYRSIFENTLVGIFQTTSEGQYITVNPACARMFGYASPEEMITSVTDIGRQLYWDPEERRRCIETLESSGTLERFEVKCRKKNSSPIWTVINSRVVRDEAGNLLLIEGVIEDITSRKQTEEALWQSEERFSKAFRSSPAMEAITDLNDGRIIDVNNKWLEALGYTREEVIGRSTTDIGVWADPQERRNILLQLKEKKRFRDVHVHTRTKSGEIRDIYMSGELVRAGSDDLFLSLARDVTDTLKAEKVLRESESRFRLLIENAPDGIYVQTQGSIVYVNDTALRMFGARSAEELLGRPFMDRIHPDFRDRVRERARIVNEEKRTVAAQEQVYLKLDGTLMEVEVSVVPIRYEGHDGALVFIRDILERKRAENALKESEERFRMVVESAPDAIFVRSESGHYLYLNHAAISLFGAESADQLIGRHINERIPLDEYASLTERIERLNAGQAVPVIEQTFLRMDGSSVTVEVSAVPLRYSGVNGALVFARDILKRKEAEKALRESERQMRALLDNIPDIVWLKDSESRFIAVNEPFAKTCGFNPEDLVGKTDCDIWPKQLAEAYQADDRDVMKSQRTKRVEEPLADARGNVSWIETIKTPIRNDRGDVIGTTGIARDITERKSVEDLYRMLSDKSLAGVYVVQDGEFKYLNTNAATYAGYAAEELVGRRSTVLVHPEDAHIARKHSSEMLRGIRQTPYEFRIIDKAGRVRWILETVTTITYEGKPAILGNSMDISQLKEAQQKLEELQALESSVLSAIPHAVLGLESRRIIFANDNVETVFGWKPAEIIGGDLAVLFSSEASCEAVTRRIATALQNGKVYSLEPEHPLVHRDGRAQDCRVTAARIGNGSGESLVATFEDITEQKMSQLHLLQSEKMASIGQLAAGVAHEINNPTGYVSSNLKTLSEYSEDLLEILGVYRDLLSEVSEVVEGKRTLSELQRRVEDIRAREEKIDMGYILDDVPALIRESREGTERIKEIVLSLKNFAHPGEEKYTYADINKNIESTLNVVWNEIKYKATVTRDYAELPEVECYPQQLNQVFMNMLVNAAQAIKTKGDITIRTRSLEDAVEISISDTGIGIPEENLARIFDPFFTTKEVGKGTGLGLNVGYNIVKKHKGTIDVKSKVGEGTTFTIRLPVHQAEPMA
jgi:PAS domain S-box-containing protein